MTPFAFLLLATPPPIPVDAAQILDLARLSFAEAIASTAIPSAFPSPWTASQAHTPAQR